MADETEKLTKTAIPKCHIFSLLKQPKGYSLMYLPIRYIHKRVRKSVLRTLNTQYPKYPIIKIVIIIRRNCSLVNCSKPLDIIGANTNNIMYALKYQQQPEEIGIKKTRTSRPLSFPSIHSRKRIAPPQFEGH